MQVYGQQVDSTRRGSISGIVRDSIHNYVLQLATLAVYRESDSTLIAYQLSNNFGAYNFNELPVDIPLKIVASYIGYRSVEQRFKIPTNTKKLLLPTLNLNKSEIILNDVIINAAPPPISMKGDTLEFNAEAFNLDRNAVAEDLLKKLPGVIIWADGAITINGKSVSSIIVNKKPFFGGDTKVAIQNLPKAAIDKIQVYQQNANPANPLDSITQINIELKKNKSIGAFGKLGGGYGSDKRYDMDVNLNVFTRKTQVAIIAANNNINKMTNNINTLLMNSTYKGTNDGGLGYQSDFNQKGINSSKAGGFTMQHDFIAVPDAYKKSRLQADYFINNVDNLTKLNTATIKAIGNDNSQLQQLSQDATFNNSNQHLNVRYEKLKNNISFFTTSQVNTNSNHEQNSQISGVYRIKELESTNQIENLQEKHNRQFLLESGLEHRDTKYGGGPHDFTIKNVLSYNNDDNSQFRRSIFRSLFDSSQNINFNRYHNNTDKRLNEQLYTSLGNFSKWLFGSGGFMSGFSITLQNMLQINKALHNNNVSDVDNTGKKINNPYLTANNDYLITNEQPALVINKNFSRGLSSRYVKNISINLVAEYQFYYQHNISSHYFQNFTRRYQHFVPAASIRYENIQLGKYQDTYFLSFSKSMNYPDLNQLASLVDSSDLYYIRYGNLSLKEADKRELSFSLKHHSFNNDKPLNYNIEVKAGIINNNFSDSIRIDNSGRSSYYEVNIDGFKYINFNGKIGRAFKFSNHQIQVYFTSGINVSSLPSYINNVKNWSDNINNTNTLGLYYSFSNYFDIQLQQKAFFFRTVQHGAGKDIFNSNIQSTEAGGSLNFNKLTIGSNISYNYTSVTLSSSRNFTIWNMNVAYRLLRSNTLELKITAMDILRQNIGIINFGSNNTLTTGTVTTLKQYFLFGIAYYPRKFGWNNTKSNDKSIDQ